MKYLVSIIFLIVLFSCDLIEQEKSKGSLNDRYLSDSVMTQEDTLSINNENDSVLLESLVNAEIIDNKDERIINFRKI